MSGPLLEVEDSTANHWVATWGDLVVIIAYEGSHADPSHVLVAGRAFVKVHARSGRPVGVLFILPPGHGKPPSAEVRDALAATIRRLEPNTSRAALVVAGSGFGSAVHRAVITGSLTLFRGRKPYKVTSTIREGLEYLLGAEEAALQALLLACEERLTTAPQPDRPR